MPRRWRVGDATITQVVEIESSSPAGFLFGDALSPGRIGRYAWLHPAHVDARGRLNGSIHCFVIESCGRRIAVDTCIGNDKPRGLPAWHLRRGTFLQDMADAGFPAESIDTVLCTHLHVDHVGWNTRLENGRWTPTFPKARYIFGRQEYDHWAAQHAKAAVAPFEDSVLPIVEAKRADIVGDDFQIGDHVRLLPTPGHTPGHFAVCFGRARDEAVMSGDLMHSPLQARYPELSAAFDTDKAQAAVTRRAFLERYCDTDTLCCTAHFPAPSAGHIRRWGDGFKCEAAV